MTFQIQRNQLIDILIQEGITNKKVLEAIKKVPRHQFIPKEYQKESYANYPLPIGQGQTISQPYTVAFMLEALELKKGNKVLEVGAGSGWNAALIGFIVGKKGEVISTEVHERLVELAKENIKKVRLKNVKVVKWDGSKGYKKDAPYDAIVLTAASPHIPKQLIGQLKNNGKLIAPVGPLYGQIIIKITKKDKKLIKENLGSFVFVPLKGKYGY